jgi:hypothetical protein
MFRFQYFQLRITGRYSSEGRFWKKELRCWFGEISKYYNKKNCRCF